jgi:hypothetical protein
MPDLYPRILFAATAFVTSVGMRREQARPVRLALALFLLQQPDNIDLPEVIVRRFDASAPAK